MMIEKLIKLLKDIADNMQFRNKLKKMDDWWYFTGAYSWELFPPSFYYTHSEEDIRRITEETHARLRALIDELEDGDCP